MVQLVARYIATILILFSSAAIAASAQQQKTPVPLTPSARLTAAKTVFMKDGGGNGIPFDVISSALEAWGRFTMVDSPEKADVVVEVSAPPPAAASASPVQLVPLAPMPAVRNRTQPPRESFPAQQ